MVNAETLIIKMIIDYYQWMIKKGYEKKNEL